MAEALYQDTMAYVGSIPWHGKGTKFEGDYMTAEDAIVGAKLDYKVEKLPLFLGDGTMTEAFATVNMSTKDVLGFVKDRYHVLQNVEAFTFFDVLLQEYGAKYVTAGAIGKGERIWLLVKMPMEFEPLLGDKVHSYCLLTNSHDGSSGVEARFTPIRVVCRNTLIAAVSGCRSTVSIRHTFGVKDKLAMAAEILREYNTHYSKVGEVFSELASFKVDDEMVENYIASLFGDPNKIPEGRGRSIAMTNIRMYRGRLSNGMGVDLPGVKNTAWWMYNAATEMVDYDRKFHTGTDKASALLWGSGADFKQKALNMALAVVR
jgi:phage/plasmid-like protein (TIGR03299 family)